MLSAALAAFAQRGYEGTSISDLAEATGVSKAAFSYHFASKDDILVELASPLLTELEGLVDGVTGVDLPNGVRELLLAYIDVLIDQRDVAIWIDGDKSVLNHPVIGPRLKKNNRVMRGLISGPNATNAVRVRASAVLGCSDPSTRRPSP